MGNWKGDVQTLSRWVSAELRAFRIIDLAMRTAILVTAAATAAVAIV